ncbi:MAG: TIM barrel protein [Planctomycetota bacterium]
MNASHSSAGARVSGVDRRAFLSAAAAAAAAGLAPRNAVAANATPPRPEICVFTKFLQSLSYDEMAAAVAEIGLDGVEATVRNKGHVLPERVEDDLPKHQEAITRHGLKTTMITTDVLDLDQPHSEKVLRTAASLGIKQYRMGFYRYDKNRGVREQLDEIGPRMRDVAALNRELGISAVYQNHSGAKYVGAPLWDLQSLLKDIPPSVIGNAFDIRHATVEGGLAWPLHYDLMKPHIGAVYVKDFKWVGKKPEHVPLGTGQVDSEFFKLHLATGPRCPISLHIEYLKKGDAQQNLAAIRRDFGVLKEWLDV